MIGSSLNFQPHSYRRNMMSQEGGDHRETKESHEETPDEREEFSTFRSLARKLFHINRKGLKDTPKKPNE